MISLRLLKANEVWSLRPLITNFFNEGNIEGKFNPQHAAKVLKAHIMDDTGFTIVGGDPVLGGISGIMYADMATGDLCCSEWFWYVNKESRGSSLGPRLLQAFEGEAKRRGAVRLTMMHLCQGDEHNAQFKRIYEKRGYKLQEQVFSKAVL